MANPTVTDLVQLLLEAPPALGHTRLLLVDGPAGSGKTTLADRLGDALQAQVIHGDDIYEGWTGLDTMWPILGERILDPLSRSKDAAFEVWDWEADRRGATLHIPAADALVIEGVGVAQRRARAFASLLVYVEAPWDVRLQRGLERDGEAMRSHWETWQASEVGFLTDEGTRDTADVIVDGSAPVTNQ